MKLIGILLLSSVSCYAQFGLGVAPGFFVPFSNSKIDPSRALEIDGIAQFNLSHFSFALKVPTVRKTITTFELYKPLNQIEKQIDTQYHLWDPKFEIAWYLDGPRSDQPPSSFLAGIDIVPFWQTPLEKQINRVTDTEVFVETRNRTAQLGYGAFAGWTFNPKYALNNKLIFSIRAGYLRYNNIKINNFEFNQFGNAVKISEKSSINAMTMNVVIVFYFEKG